MTDLDRLEQLKRLHDQGALSDIEFEQQKASLLSAQSRKPFIPTPLLAVGVLAIVLAVVGVIIWSPQNNKAGIIDSNAADKNSGPSLDRVVDIASLAPRAAPTPGSQPSYAWSTSQDMLGLNPVYVESKLGPAREKSQSGLEYEIAGCRVYYGIKDGKVDYVSTQVSSKCHPEIDGKILNERTTFRDVSPGGLLVADCISVCGNAYEPTIDIFVPGSHVGGFVQTLYTGANGDPTSKGQEAWAAAIRQKHGLAEDDYANSEADWFQCLTDAPASTAAAMASEHIDMVTFGYSVGSTCDLN